MMDPVLIAVLGIALLWVVFELWEGRRQQRMDAAWEALGALLEEQRLAHVAARAELVRWAVMNLPPLERGETMDDLHRWTQDRILSRASVLSLIEKDAERERLVAAWNLLYG